MNTVSPQETHSRLQRAASAVSPNLPIALFILGGFGSECVLLARAPTRPLLAGPLVASLTIAMIFWSCLTAGWLLFAATSAERVLTRPWPSPLRIALRGLLALALAAVAVVWVASWIVFLRTGTFVTYDALMFGLVDYRDMAWFYASRSEPLSLAALGVLLAVLVAALPFYLIAAGKSRWNVPKSGVTALRLLVWVAAGAAVILLRGRVDKDESETRHGSRIEALEGGVDPIYALASSWNAARRAGPIEPSLDRSLLIPSRDTAWEPAPPSGHNRPSIIFVKIESMRHDVIGLRRDGLQIMPVVDALAAKGAQFTHAYAPSTHTDYSDVSTLSSLYPLRTRNHHYYRAEDPWPKALIYDLLKKAGYSTALVSAENLAWGKMDRFLQSPGLDLFYDAERNGGTTAHVWNQDVGIAKEVRLGVLSAGVLDDAGTTDVALDWVERQGNRPFFLWLDLQSPHFPYILPDNVPRPFQPATIDFDVSFLRYPFKKTYILRNAYDNALHESDRQLGRLLDGLARGRRLDDTILVIYGDHGEAFHENGKVTHAGEPIEVVARTSLILVAAGRLAPRRDDYPAELIDVVPTVLALAGLPAHPNFQGINLLAENRPPRSQRLLFVHTENPISRMDAAILGGRWKLTLDRRRNTRALYDLEEDPAGENDVSRRFPDVFGTLGRLLDQWRERQLAYYYYPFYYKTYYPPPPPHVRGLTAASLPLPPPPRSQ